MLDDYYASLRLPIVSKQLYLFSFKIKKLNNLFRLKYFYNIIIYSVTKVHIGRIIITFVLF